MSEKRFELRGLGVFDTENDNKSLSRVDVVELLNEQQDTINKLKEERDYWKAKYDEGTETFESNLLDKIPPKIREIWLK